MDELRSGLVVEGYASVFGLRDLNDDVVVAGAFRDSVALGGAGGVKMLYQHEPDEPIGVWTDIYEDYHGLYVVGRVFTDTSRGRLAARLVQAGALDGLSIGYRVHGSRQDDTRRLRYLTKLELWEVSLVTFPMLPQARVSRFGGEVASDQLAAQTAQWAHQN